MTASRSLTAGSNSNRLNRGLGEIARGRDNSVEEANQTVAFGDFQDALPLRMDAETTGSRPGCPPRKSAWQRASSALRSAWLAFILAWPAAKSPILPVPAVRLTHDDGDAAPTFPVFWTCPACLTLTLPLRTLARE